MQLNESEIKKILIIGLSNIGDCILTLPAIDLVKSKFPDSEIHILAGDKSAGIFSDNPAFKKFITYQKKTSFFDKIKLIKGLQKEGFDMVIDFRNTMIPLFLKARYKTNPFLSIPKNIPHMYKRHLYRVESLIGKGMAAQKRESFYISKQDQNRINIILKDNNLQKGGFVVVASGAASHTKRWLAKYFASACESIIKDYNLKVILVGDGNDKETSVELLKNMQCPALDLCGKTSLKELGALVRQARLVISNDSAVMHLSSYLDIPTIAIFGPSSDTRYGPWSGNSRIVKKEIFCRPCQKAQCRFGTLGCIELIKPDDFLRQLKDLLRPANIYSKPRYDFKRILISRTDRLGDVVLSTPAIRAMREAYPNAYIAVMVSPYARDIVQGNPYLDEVILCDKDLKHKGLFGLLRLSFTLRRRDFDIAVILHPTNRVHLVCFLAGIKRRLGFNRKLGFLLTDRIEHQKQLGAKHEVEYSLDMVRYLGIEPRSKELFMPIKDESEVKINELFRKNNIKNTDKLLAINPGASCPSKIWPNARFAEVADSLIEKYGFKVIMLSSPKESHIAEAVSGKMKRPSINLASKTSISELASLLRRCSLFISNDSGPVHIAVALGVPVLSIFGRNQKGISPMRWGPLGPKDRFIHKDVGCVECLAHNCKRGFLCLYKITTQDVLEAVDSILEIPKYPLS